MDKRIEYEDAYVIEEKVMKNDLDENLDEDLNDQLSLDESEESGEDLKILSLDYDKLKSVAEQSKKKIDNSDNKKQKIIDFIPKVVNREEVVDDFIRNFFTKYNLNKTLEEFNKEYNELAKKGKFNDNYLGPITDAHIKNAKLEERHTKMKKELEKAKKNADEAKSQWESLRKERDFHKDNFKKTVEEKEIIARDIKQLKKLHEDFTLKIVDLKQKYENLCKNKALMRLEKEKLDSKCNERLKQVENIMLELKKIDENSKKDLLEDQNILKLPKIALRPGQKTPWPKDFRNNLYMLQNYTQMNYSPSQIRNIKIHEKPVACLSVHIKKAVIATGGDDCMFKIFNCQNYEELVSGSGHSDYVCGIDIHPKGLFLATCSGDHSIKLWDLTGVKCKSTFYDHNSIVWSCKFHDTGYIQFKLGNFLLSCSEDSSIRLWDLNQMKCRKVYTGHTDSVNKVNFQPFTNYFTSCSSDKSISIWDMRGGLPVQTFYGHLNSINDVVFNVRGDTLYSCDGDGIIKVWDVRKIQEMNTFTAFPGVSANCIEVDKSCSIAYVGHDNGQLVTINLNKNVIAEKKKAHEGSINGIGINLQNTNVFTVGSDGYLNVWN